MQGLDEIGLEYNTDKASRWRASDGKMRKGHGYLEIYERYFSPIRTQSVNIIELGCGPTWNIGASLRTFAKYFPSARISGVDIRPDAENLKSEGFNIITGDLGRIDFLRRIARSQPCDVLIDDASHVWHHQILAAIELFDIVKPGGIYIIEDIHTSFAPRMRESYAAGRTYSAFDFIVDIQRAINLPASVPDTSPYPDHVRHIAANCAQVVVAKGTCLLIKK